MRTWVLLGVVLCVLLGVAGCAVPSVPVPPPNTNAMSFALDETSHTATYSARLGPSWAGAWVIVRDDETGEGVVARADADGDVGPTRPFTAFEGDQIFITFETGDQSSGVCLILHDGPANANDECT